MNKSIKNRIINLLEYGKKIRLLKDRGYYKTMSGCWRDSHCMRIYTRRDISHTPLNILTQIL